VVAFHHLCRNTQEAVPIFVVLEDRLAPVAPGGDVIQGTGKFDAQGSCDAKTLVETFGCDSASADPHLDSSGRVSFCIIIAYPAISFG